MSGVWVIFGFAMALTLVAFLTGVLFGVEIA